MLRVRDTTELDFTSQPGGGGIAGLGRLSYERQHGMYVHPTTLAVSEDGVALGVLDAWTWARKPKGEADLVESLRWTEGYQRVAELAARLVYVVDREGGLRALIYLAANLVHPADYLVRARHDRALDDGGKLRAEVERQAALGEVEFRLPPAPWGMGCLLTGAGKTVVAGVCLRHWIGRRKCSTTALHPVPFPL